MRRLGKVLRDRRPYRSDGQSGRFPQRVEGTPPGPARTEPSTCTPKPSRRSRWPPRPDAIFATPRIRLGLTLQVPPVARHSLPSRSTTVAMASRTFSRLLPLLRALRDCERSRGASRIHSPATSTSWDSRTAPAISLTRWRVGPHWQATLARMAEKAPTSWMCAPGSKGGPDGSSPQG